MDSASQNQPCVSRLKGFLFAFLSAACFSVMMLCVKLVPHVHAFEVCFFRMLIQTVLCAPYFLCVPVDFNPVFKSMKLTPSSAIQTGSSYPSWCSRHKIPLLLLLRASASSFAFNLSYYAVQTTSMADATAILFSSPLVVTLLAVIILKEKVGLADVATVILTVVGCVFVAHPSVLFGTVAMSHVRVVGLLSAVGGCLLMSVTYIVIRYLRDDVHWMIIVTSMSLWGSIQSAMVCTVTGTWSLPNTSLQWGLLGAVGGLACLGQVFLTKAFQYEKAALVSLVRSLDIVLAFLYEAFLLHHKTSTWSIVGASMVVSGVIAAGLKKALCSEAETEKDRHQIQSADHQSSGVTYSLLTDPAHIDADIDKT